MSQFCHRNIFEVICVREICKATIWKSKVVSVTWSLKSKICLLSCISGIHSLYCLYLLSEHQWFQMAERKPLQLVFSPPPQKSDEVSVHSMNCLGNVWRWLGEVQKASLNQIQSLGIKFCPVEAPRRNV